jgi:FMN reductase
MPARPRSPGLHLGHSAHTDRTALAPSAAELAAGYGRAPADLAAAVRASPAPSAIEPQV